MSREAFPISHGGRCVKKTRLSAVHRWHNRPAAESGLHLVSHAGWNTLNTVIHELARGDVTLTHTPMFHTGALFVHTLPLLTLGGKVVIMRRWTADDMLALIESERVTRAVLRADAVPDDDAVARFTTTDLSSLRFLTSGGAPLPVPIIHAYRQRHGVVFKLGFSMTEFGPGGCSLSPEYAESKAGSDRRRTTSSKRASCRLITKAIRVRCPWRGRRVGAAALRLLGIFKIPRPRPRRSMPKAGSTPATWRAVMPMVSTTSPTARRTCSSRGRERLSRRDRKGPFTPTPRLA